MQRENKRISGPFRVVAATLLPILGACSGSDFEKLGSDFADHVTKEVAGIEPSELEKPGEQAARGRDFARRADTLFATGAYEASVAATAACTGIRCTLTVAGDGGASLERTVSDLFPADISRVAKGATTNGVTAFSYSTGAGSRETYGNWMTHSVYGVAEEPGWRRDGVTAYFGFAAGDLTGSRPSARATWNGGMSGAVAKGGQVGTRLVGGANLALSIADNTVDVVFSDIRDNSNNQKWTIASIEFEDVPVKASGTFESGDSGNLIRGGFYGAGHAEAAGVFEKGDIVGGFGVKR